jgi:hypothetical protein
MFSLKWILKIFEYLLLLRVKPQELHVDDWQQLNKASPADSVESAMPFHFILHIPCAM